MKPRHISWKGPLGLSVEAVRKRPQRYDHKYMKYKTTTIELINKYCDCLCSVLYSKYTGRSKAKVPIDVGVDFPSCLFTCFCTYIDRLSLNLTAGRVNKRCRTISLARDTIQKWYSVIWSLLHSPRGPLRLNRRVKDVTLMFCSHIKLGASNRASYFVY